MDIPQSPQSPSPVPSGNARSTSLSVDRQAAWQALLVEMTELHARLEYLRVMLKLGVRGF